MIDFMREKFPILVSLTNMKLIPTMWFEDTFRKGDILMKQNENTQIKNVYIIIEGGVSVFKQI